MVKTSATHLIAFMIFATYLAVVAVVSFFARPSGVIFPCFVFFLGIFILPCLVSWLLALIAARMGFIKRLVLLLVAIAAFIVLYYLQLKGLVKYALAQPDPNVEGLISNFFVFSYHFLERSVLSAGTFLLLFTFIWPKIKRVLGPNNSFKPNPLRGSA
jgi:hypothetical protein